MASSRLEELIEYNADVTLEFEDGTLAANSTLLGLYSSVLRSAVEVEAAAGGDGTSTSGGTQDKPCTRIPMPGTKKEDWMLVSAFLYPVLPPCSITSWTQLETLLTVAASFDIPLVLHKADQYLLDHSSELDAETPESEKCVWKWLRLADKAGLQDCLSVLAARAAEVDRQGCAAMERLSDFSVLVLKQLLVACAGQAGAPRVGDACTKSCGNYSCYGANPKKHTLKWVCSHCSTTHT